MYIKPGLSNLLLIGWWRTMQLALREMPARRARPARFSPERTAHLLAGLVGGPIRRHTENHAFRTERNARLPNKKKKGKKDGVRPVEHM